MKIAFVSIYPDSNTQDRLFDPEMCYLGENLSVPGIMLRDSLVRRGDEVHTIDLFDDYDIVLFQDIPVDSWLVIHTLADRLRYIVRRKWRWDYLLKAVRHVPKEKRLLLICEPASVAPQSHDKRLHQYFDRILTWNDDLVDHEMYFKFFIPQYWDHTILTRPYAEKRKYVIMASNKRSNHPNELYSKRRAVIDYFEGRDTDDFDLYGFGWEGQGLRNYKGTVKKKLLTLSGYRFCFCFENVAGVNGYITEKLFDCLFSGCVPVYLGANNVLDYIPGDVFVDARAFASIDEMVAYLENVTEAGYEAYLTRAKEFLESKDFADRFSVQNYVTTVEKFIDGKR